MAQSLYRILASMILGCTLGLGIFAEGTEAAATAPAGVNLRAGDGALQPRQNKPQRRKRRNKKRKHVPAQVLPLPTPEMQPRPSGRPEFRIDPGDGPPRVRPTPNLTPGPTPNKQPER